MGPAVADASRAWGLGGRGNVERGAWWSRKCRDGPGGRGNVEDRGNVETGVRLAWQWRKCRDNEEVKSVLCNVVCVCVSEPHHATTYHTCTSPPHHTTHRIVHTHGKARCFLLPRHPPMARCEGAPPQRPGNSWPCSALALLRGCSPTAKKNTHGRSKGSCLSARAAPAMALPRVLPQQHSPLVFACRGYSPSSSC